MQAKVRFNVRALLRLACNIVTDPDTYSTVTRDSLAIIAGNETMMEYISSVEA